MSHHEIITELKNWLSLQIIGQERLIDRLLIALLADGHLLVEGAPGLAKTKAIKDLSRAIEGDFHRIQFTPDLLPSDITGTEVYRPEDGSFRFQQGPIFHNLVLADEINRAPAKVQSALLEAMGEHQVSVGRESFQLPPLFLVMATQNPIEQEGTYPLPEAQIDRFMLKLHIDYPSKEEEKLIMQRMSTSNDPYKVQPVVDPADIVKARKVIDEIYIDENLQDYIINLVTATRDPKANQLSSYAGMIQFGASPRASIFLNRAAKAYAFLQRRGYVVPHDIKSIGMDVLRHRIILTYEAEAENVSADDILKSLFD
ncbi:MAG: MoxR family ATPase, partial [Gammaproteobacteria bacterium]|nr:MoxR family ATPase [Gammaproteobacteria bacterium]